MNSMYDKAINLKEKYRGMSETQISLKSIKELDCINGSDDENTKERVLFS